MTVDSIMHNPTPALISKLARHGILTAAEASLFSENDYINGMGFNDKELGQVKTLLAKFGFRLSSPEKTNAPICLSEKDFDALDDYSCSIPTGTYVGKRWKRRHPYVHYPDVVPTWTMGEYYEYGDHGRVGINWRPIVVANAATLLYEVLRQIPFLWATNANFTGVDQ